MTTPQIPHDCQPGDWVDVYYGWECRVCKAFVAHGCEPWGPVDDGTEPDEDAEDLADIFDGG